MENESESTESPFDYFAYPQYRDFELLFQYHPKRTPQSAIRDGFHWHNLKMADIQ